MAMMDIIKRPFRSFDGTKWIKHYFETSADQVKCTKNNGEESDVQTQLTELNGKLQWKLIGKANGDALINADLTAYREIMCVAKSGVSTLIYTAQFPSLILDENTSVITMTGACFKTSYGLSQKTAVINATKAWIKLSYVYETTVTETPSNTVDRTSFFVYAR